MQGVEPQGWAQRDGGRKNRSRLSYTKAELGRCLPAAPDSQLHMHVSAVNWDLALTPLLTAPDSQEADVRRGESGRLQEERREVEWGPLRGVMREVHPELWWHMVCGFRFPEDEASSGSCVLCPRLGPFCGIPAIPSMTPFPA